MPSEPGVFPLALDLAGLARRSVTSLYSNLVTRPTGRAVRLGLESQLSEMQAPTVCVSVLDFSDVRVLDYSCADEIVAKLLLRFHRSDRINDVYLLVRGLHEHHRDAIQAVLEQHDLILAAEQEGSFALLGPANSVERACWNALVRLGRASARTISADLGWGEAAAHAAVASLVARRVAVRMPQTEVVCALPALVAL